MDAVVIQVVLFSTVGACVYMFRSLRRSVKQQQCSKAKSCSIVCRRQLPAFDSLSAAFFRYRRTGRAYRCGLDQRTLRAVADSRRSHRYGSGSNGESCVCRHPRYDEDWPQTMKR